MVDDMKDSQSKIGGTLHPWLASYLLMNCDDVPASLTRRSLPAQLLRCFLALVSKSLGHPIRPVSPWLTRLSLQHARRMVVQFLTNIFVLLSDPESKTINDVSSVLVGGDR